MFTLNSETSASLNNITAINSSKKLPYQVLNTQENLTYVQLQKNQSNDQNNSANQQKFNYSSQQIKDNSEFSSENQNYVRNFTPTTGERKEDTQYDQNQQFIQNNYGLNLNKDERGYFNFIAQESIVNSNIPLTSKGKVPMIKLTNSTNQPLMGNTQILSPSNNNNNPYNQIQSDNYRGIQNNANSNIIQTQIPNKNYSLQRSTTQAEIDKALITNGNPNDFPNLKNRRFTEEEEQNFNAPYGMKQDQLSVRNSGAAKFYFQKKIDAGSVTTISSKSTVQKKEEYNGIGSNVSYTTTLESAQKQPKEQLTKASKGLADFVTKIDRNDLSQMPVQSDQREYLRVSEVDRGNRQSSTPNLNENQLTNKNQFTIQTHQGQQKTENNLTSDVILSSQNKGREDSGNFQQNPISMENSQFEKVPKEPEFQYYNTSMQTHLKKAIPLDYFNKLYRQHFFQSYHALESCKRFQPDMKQLKEKVQMLPKRDPTQTQTIVFDLDQTLIHCNQSSDMPCDVILPIRFPSGEIVDAGVNIRPFAYDILKQLSQIFEIIVFTASHECYASQVLDHLDPENIYISHRLYRESCSPNDEGIHVKDLRVFGDRDPKSIVLVDNAAYSYAYQLDSGIPIIPFYNNKSDKELKHLMGFLQLLENVPDVREFNRQFFQIHHFVQSDRIETVLDQIYGIKVKYFQI